MNTDITPRRIRALILAILAVAFAATGLWWASERDTAQSNSADRLAEVAERGSVVMPFDLDKTTHSFQPTDEGGRQTVTADDPADTGQIRLIREHLTDEAARFAAGDFADPATIHGDDMPGLADLRAGAARIAVRYEELPAGARLYYTTSEPQLRTALHRWFEAQSSDHGTDAHDNGGR